MAGPIRDDPDTHVILYKMETQVDINAKIPREYGRLVHVNSRFELVFGLEPDNSGLAIIVDAVNEPYYIFPANPDEAPPRKNRPEIGMLVKICSGDAMYAQTFKIADEKRMPIEEYVSHIRQHSKEKATVDEATSRIYKAAYDRAEKACNVSRASLRRLVRLGVSVGIQAERDLRKAVNPDITSLEQRLFPDESR